MPPQNPIDINALRQALIAQAMQRQNPIAYPSNILQPRTMPNAALPSGAPNTPGPVIPSQPQPPQSPPVVTASPRVGPANPAQSMAQVGQTAQSPMFDQGTRDVAKLLVTKLLKHI